MSSKEILKQYEVAELLSVSLKTLQAWRYKGEGPKYYQPRMGVIRYYRKDVLDWLECQRDEEVPI